MHVLALRMTATSPLSDISYYDEIDVPFAAENVIAAVPDSVYRTVLLDLSKTPNLNAGGEKFSLQSLLIRLLTGTQPNQPAQPAAPAAAEPIAAQAVPVAP